MGADVFWAMLQRMIFSAPVMMMWLIAILVGMRVLQSDRRPALCLIGAAVIELAHHGLGVLLVPIPAVLFEANVLGSAGLSGFALLRAVVSLCATVVAYTLLILAMLGWRRPG
jgi:hypothetical protein